MNREIHNFTIKRRTVAGWNIDSYVYIYTKPNKNFFRIVFDELNERTGRYERREEVFSKEFLITYLGWCEQEVVFD